MNIIQPRLVVIVAMKKIKTQVLESLDVLNVIWKLKEIKIAL